MSHSAAPPITAQDFARVEVRVGRVVSAERFRPARKPAYVLQVDFGPQIGLRKSSAQITDRDALEALVGRLAVADVDLPPRQTGPLMSECLVNGLPDADGSVALCVPDADVPPGTRLL